MKPTFIRLFFALLGTAFLFGCASEEIPSDASESEIFLLAQQHMVDENFESATITYRELEGRFPYSPYATQAQLESIYAYYQNFENIETVAAAERFIRLHPRHPHVDYAYYMRGLATYHESSNPFSRYLPGLNVEQRDLGALKDAYEYFAQLTDRFPESYYSADARLRMIYIRNLIGAREIQTARFYEAKGYPVAAINRSLWVLTNLQQTPYTSEALSIMIKNYCGVGLSPLAKQSAEILALNDPTHELLSSNGQLADCTADEIALLTHNEAVENTFATEYIEKISDQAEEYRVAFGDLQEEIEEELEVAED